MNQSGQKESGKNIGKLKELKKENLAVLHLVTFCY